MAPETFATALPVQFIKIVAVHLPLLHNKESIYLISMYNVYLVYNTMTYQNFYMKYIRILGL